MRGMTRIGVLAILLCSVLAAMGWWYYGAFSWNYPQWKSRARLKIWRMFGDPLDKESKRIAGRDAINCGVSDGREEHTNRVTGCISDAVSHHRGFHARFSYFGTEAYGAEGLAGAPDGPIYELVLRISPVFSGEDVLLVRRACPAPLRIAFRENSPIPGCAPFAASANDYEVLRDDGVRNRAAIGY
jgi:hypothetical protein